MKGDLASVSMPVISAMIVFRTLLGQVLRHMRQRRYLGSALVFTLLLIVGTGLSITMARNANYALDASLRAALFQVAPITLVLILGGRLWSDWHASKLLHYYFGRPHVRRLFPWSIALPTVVGTLFLIGVGALSLGLLLTLTDTLVWQDYAPKLMRAFSGLALLTLVYTAMAAFWHAYRPHTATNWMLRYWLVFEFGASFIPGPFRLLSMNYLAQGLGGLPPKGWLADSTPQLSTPLVLLILSAVSLTFWISSTRGVDS